MTPASLLLRPMRAEDIGPAVQMHQRAFEHGAWSADAMAREFSDHRLSVYYILECTGEGRQGPDAAPAGMFGCWRMPDEMHLVTICVEPSRQRRGLGRLLVNLALRLAEREGKTTMHLEARARNARARALYAGLGFREDSVRRRLYANPPDDGILISREIAPGPERRSPVPLEIDWGGEIERWDARGPAVYSTAASTGGAE